MHVYLQGQLILKMCIYRRSAVISDRVIGESFTTALVLFLCIMETRKWVLFEQCIPIKQLFGRVHIDCLNKTIIRYRNKPYPFRS